MDCRQCGAQNAENAKFCKLCGTRLDQTHSTVRQEATPALKKACSVCGALSVSESKFCGKCGFNFTHEPEAKKTATPPLPSAGDVHRPHNASQNIPGPTTTTASLPLREAKTSPHLPSSTSLSPEAQRREEMAVRSESANSRDIPSPPSPIPLKSPEVSLSSGRKSGYQNLAGSSNAKVSPKDNAQPDRTLPRAIVGALALAIAGGGGWFYFGGKSSDSNAGVTSLHEPAPLATSRVPPSVNAAPGLPTRSAPEVTLPAPDSAAEPHLTPMQALTSQTHIVPPPAPMQASEQHDQIPAASTQKSASPAQTAMTPPRDHVAMENNVPSGPKSEDEDDLAKMQRELNAEVMAKPAASGN